MSEHQFAPLDLNEFAEICHNAHIAFCLDKFPSSERALEHFYIEHLNSRTPSSPATEPDERSEREIAWTDKDGVHHSMPQCAVESLLERFWDEWPGGWSEVEAEKRARALSAPTAPAQAEPVGENCDVRKILLKVVPGDGDGYEVYPNSIADVEAELSDLGLRLEEWEMGIRRLATPPSAATPEPSDAERLDAERWRAFIGLDYELRAEWATNLSLAPVLTKWVDNRIDYLRAEGQK